MRIWCAAFLLLAGCIDLEHDSPYGDFELEGHVVGASIWGSQATTVLEGPSIAEPRSNEPVPSPGLGQQHMLEVPAGPVAVDVRAVQPLDGHLDWFVHHLDREAAQFRPDALHSQQKGDAQARTKGNETARLALDGPGLWAIVAQGSGGRSDPFYVAVDLQWSVTGEVFPQRASGDPEPPGYDEMTDRFVVSMPTSVKGVRIQTFFDGGDELGAGTVVDDVLVGDDVDVGLWGADGTPIVCEGSNGSLGRAAELLEAEVDDVTVYDIAFAVGAMPDGCSGSTWHYDNQRPVPYRATLQTGYYLLLG